MRKRFILLYGTLILVLAIMLFAIYIIKDSTGKASDTRQNTLNAETNRQNEASALSHTPSKVPENAHQFNPEAIMPTVKPDADEAAPTGIAVKDGNTQAPSNEPLEAAEPDEANANEAIPVIATDKGGNGDAPTHESLDTAKPDEKTPDTNEAVPSVTAEKNENADMPPSGSNDTAEPDEITPGTDVQETGGGNVEPDPIQASKDITYKAFFTQEGEAYTLIADSLTKSFLVLDNATQTIRPTGYKYISYFEDFPDGRNPILGSMGDLFAFLAYHEVIASDGEKEWVLTTIGEADMADKIQTGYIFQDGSKILANIFSQPDHVLLLIDLNTPIAYKFPGVSFHGEIIVITDDYVFFGVPGGNMTSGYRCPLYKVHEGEIEIIGIIPRSEIYEYTLEGNIVHIQLGDLSYRVDLESSQITSSVPVNDEFCLYYPVFCNATIGDLSEMKFIHNNQVQSIQLPDGWTANCTYFGEKWYFSFETTDPVKRSLTQNGYFNRLEPYENQPIPKFPESAVVKKLLYSGTCFIGECEIYLLERTELYRISTEKTYEMIYAYLPYEDGIKAYELNVYVPLGEDYEAYFTMMKTMLKIE